VLQKFLKLVDPKLSSLVLQIVAHGMPNIMCIQMWALKCRDIYLLWRHLFFAALNLGPSTRRVVV
jgi:hypothetical protein